MFHKCKYNLKKETGESIIVVHALARMQNDERDGMASHRNLTRILRHFTGSAFFWTSFGLFWQLTWHNAVSYRVKGHTKRPRWRR